MVDEHILLMMLSHHCCCYCFLNKMQLCALYIFLLTYYAYEEYSLLVSYLYETVKKLAS